MNPQPIIIYITSRGHSGSTLLDLLISSHSRVTTVGELKVLSYFHGHQRRLQILHERKCVCGAPTKFECRFWSAVDAHLRRHAGLDLTTVDVCSEDPETFRTHNLAVFRAVMEITGTPYIVDSSKTLDRLKKLIAAEAFDVRPIHLIRSPHGVVYSNMKKGRSWLYHTRNYLIAMMRTLELLSRYEHFTVHYETLCRHPRQTISGVMHWLGLEFEERQLDWAAHEHHNIAGNRMRYSGSSEIRLDETWKSHLNPFQKAAISLITLPTRNSGRWLFPLWVYPMSFIRPGR